MNTVTNFFYSSLPRLFDLLQTKKSGSMPDQDRAIESVPTQADRETFAPLLSGDRVEKQFVELTAPNKTAPEIKKVVRGSVVTLEGIYQGKPIRVRIFGEPAQDTTPEIKEYHEL